MDKNENTLLVILRMETLALLHESENTAKGKHNSKNGKTDKKAESDVGNDKAKNGTTTRTSGPVNIPALKTQKFKRPLKPLEYWKVLIDVTLLFHLYERNDYSPPIPKNRGRAWAAAIRNTQAPTIIMMLFLTSCSSLFILM